MVAASSSIILVKRVYTVIQQHKTLGSQGLANQDARKGKVEKEKTSAEGRVNVDDVSFFVFPFSILSSFDRRETKEVPPFQDTYSSRAKHETCHCV